MRGLPGRPESVQGSQMDPNSLERESALYRQLLWALLAHSGEVPDQAVVVVASRTIGWGHLAAVGPNRPASSLNT